MVQESGPWLSERRRVGASIGFASLVAAVFSVVLGTDALLVPAVDAAVLVLLAYLVGYLAVTMAAFAAAPPARIHAWAYRERRGTLLQRYVLGSAPGPGVSIFIAVVALAVAMFWMPGHGGGNLPEAARVTVAVALVVVGWVCVVVSFAVAFHADDLLEGEQALEFPGEQDPEWADYVYFAVSVMTTFGTSDVIVKSREMRRTVTTNAVIAFLFNTVTIASVVSVLNS